jgi:bifunctional UDP-N-acetylglucosamine pyrophosphorylase/glucosamine-1-phosphate N-acetyltransferase
MAVHLIVLAAGQGTRMKSSVPKVLHEVGGRPLLHHALASGTALDPESVVVVTGHGSDRVAAALEGWAPSPTIVRQDRQLGTAHAVLQARDALAGAEGDVLVLYGDTPFVRPETLKRMRDARAAGHDVVILGFEAADPGRYGRLVLVGDRLERIVEAKDATEPERAIRLCNSGVVMADGAALWTLLSTIGNENAAGEYYLTDIVAEARERGLTATAVICDENETLGVDSRAALAHAEAAFQAAARRAALEAGVTLRAPETVQFSFDTDLAADVSVEANVVFGPGVRVGRGARIRAFSHLERCRVGPDATVGPYARLRPGAEVGEAAHIGNFVEIKAAEIGQGAKVNHLSYIGDAEIGPGTNIGAGTVTCNYDGVFKHRTVIGADAFIGSDTMLVAPVSVGDGAMTATGSVVTQDVPDGAMAVARARQTTKPDFARRFFARLRAAKEG